MADDRDLMGSTAGAAASLARRVRDAATQRLHLRARETDREFRQNGGTLVHSIDTNIVVLYLDPARAPGVRRGRRRVAPLRARVRGRPRGSRRSRLGSGSPTSSSTAQRSGTRCDGRARSSGNWRGVFDASRRLRAGSSWNAEGELARLQDSVGAFEWLSRRPLHPVNAWTCCWSDCRHCAGSCSDLGVRP